jgi:hypothetical protein
MELGNAYDNLMDEPDEECVHEEKMMLNRNNMNLNRIMAPMAPLPRPKMMRMMESNMMMTQAQVPMAGMGMGPMNNMMGMNMAMNNFASPMMAANFLNVMPNSMNLKQEDILMPDRAFNVNQAFERAEREMGAEFEKPGIAKEYKERHYYIKEHKYSKIENPLWLDFAEHILKNKIFDNFLSKYVLYNQIDFNEYLMILSIIGLPINVIRHNYQAVPNSRFIEITPASNLILFTKELKETQTNLNNKLLISQNVIDELHNDKNVNTNNCTIGISYNHQTIVTNISNQTLSFQLFIQIPQGSICLNSSYYSNLLKVQLNPYQTTNYSNYFYFPKEGKYQQYHPVACKNSKVISVGTGLSYNVKKEYIPSKKIGEVRTPLVPR